MAPPEDFVEVTNVINSRAFEHQEQSYQTQIEEFKAERIERIQSIADKIIEGKRKKMLQEMSKRRKLDEEQSEPVVDREGVINQEIANIKPITRCSLNFLSIYLQIFPHPGTCK